MRLTVYTDYSLRVLIYLAVKPERLSTIDEVADAYGIARNHLTKVVHQLGVAGYVTTVRGKGGGFRLAKAPADINIGDVVRKSETDLALVPCFAPICGPCPIIPACGLKGLIHQAVQAFMAVLDGSTLADLVRQPEALRSLLQLSAIPQPPTVDA
jgi:Rrf2 family nitric oxide-sensitive transcriptional repressor